MLDTLLARHLLIQFGRIAFALFLLLLLAALGASILRWCRVVIEDRVERLLLQFAIGFAAYQCVVRWLSELPIGIAVIVILLTIVSIPGWRPLFEDLRDVTLPRDGWSIAILLLLLAPLSMALAPAVSRDALVYHLRFPEMTLRLGRWAYDPASSTSFYPSAAGTLYLPALAVDGNGVIAQLVHFGFFILCIFTIAAIARRLGAPTGRPAALLFASLPVAAVVAGWAWADMAFVFALATSALALLTGVPVLALVLLGLATSIKYTALIAGIPLFLAALWMFVRARAFRQLLLGVVLGTLVVSPWFVTNLVRTGNPLYPLGQKEQPTTTMAATWSGDAQQSWFDVWSGYFLRPQTLDEDVGGVLFLVIAMVGFAIALPNRRLHIAAVIALLMWIVFLPLTAAMRLLLPAVVATLVIAGAAFEQLERRRRFATALIAVFALRGGLVTAAHNAHFFNPLLAAVGIEDEASYVHRTVAASPLFERANAKLPPNARVLGINEVRLFRFPRPITASRNLDPPVIRRYVANAATPEIVVQRLRSDGITHLLIATRPVERGGIAIPLTKQEEQLVSAVLRRSRVIDREGELLLFELR